MSRLSSKVVVSFRNVQRVSARAPATESIRGLTHDRARTRIMFTSTQKFVLGSNWHVVKKNQHHTKSTYRLLF